MTNRAEGKYQFERLTPIDNMDLDVYEEAIGYVFDNSDVKNVAISSPPSGRMIKATGLCRWLFTHNNFFDLKINLAFNFNGG